MNAGVAAPDFMLTEDPRYAGKTVYRSTVESERYTMSFTWTGADDPADLKNKKCTACVVHLRDYYLWD